VEVKYAATTQEQSANALYDWLELHGASFGWTRTFDLDAFQAKANAGQVAILCAQRSNRNASGHIVAVVPERGSHAAQRGSDGVVTRPLQSQAGARNFRYDAPHWWTHSKFHAFGFWLHD
jgi:hypothetical protein